MLQAAAEQAGIGLGLADEWSSDDEESSAAVRGDDDVDVHAREMGIFMYWSVRALERRNKVGVDHCRFDRSRAPNPEFCISLFPIRL